MATYYIYRKDKPFYGTRQLEAHARAFRTLYCGIMKTDPELEIIIKGEWPDAFGGDGLWLRNNSGAKVVKIGRKFITLEYKDEMNKVEQVQVELTPRNGTGFTEIMFITMSRPAFNPLSEPDDENQVRWRKGATQESDDFDDIDFSVDSDRLMYYKQDMAVLEDDDE